jgi:hypothetical protein
MKRRTQILVIVLSLTLAGLAAVAAPAALPGAVGPPFDQVIRGNARDLLEPGREVFRFDTFGDETFWGDTLKLHRAIAGEALGGVAPEVSPRTALTVGLNPDGRTAATLIPPAYGLAGVNLHTSTGRGR